MGEPDVAEYASEQPTLTRSLGGDAERTEPPVDRVGVHALAVVDAANLGPPLRRGRHAEPAQIAPRAIDERRVRGAEAELDAPARPTAAGDRRIGVRHQLGEDLREVEPSLGEVLPEVAAPHAPAADCSRVDGHRHGRSLRPRSAASGERAALRDGAGSGSSEQ